MTTQPNRTSEIFELLSKGQFICSNSSDERIRTLYNLIDEQEEVLAAYFSQIDLILERSDEYFYFSRRENRTDMERKIEAAYKWIDILDFFKAYDNAFGPGTRFSPADIVVQLNVDAVLKSKLSALRRYTKEDKFTESVQKLIDLLCRDGVVELENELTHSYKVLASFSYLENLIMSIHIPEEIQNEIPE